MKFITLSTLRLFALVLSLVVILGMANELTQRKPLLDPIAIALDGRADSIVVLHFEKPVHPNPNIDIAGFQWWTDGVPHIMMKPALNPFDMRFLCIFNHEYAHVVEGEWHGTKADPSCGPHLLNIELVYPEDTSDTRVE